MVNRRNIRKWVDALRSGDYKQCLGQLRDDAGEEGYSYCCLGVATDLFVQASDETWSEWRDEGMLPDPVADWLGLAHEEGSGNPWILTEAVADDPLDAIAANDQRGWNFDDIAAAIERSYLNG